MALATMIEKLNAARKEYKEQLRAFGTSMQAEVCKMLAENIPPGWMLKWTGGTPSFNDGEPCRFSLSDPYLHPVDEEDGEGFDLGTVIKRYGTPDEEREYKQNDYARPIPGKRGEYEQTTVKYVSPGFPAIEGFSKERLEALRGAWIGLDEDLMERTFGDGHKVTVYADGAFEVDEYYE